MPSDSSFRRSIARGARPDEVFDLSRSEERQLIAEAKAGDRRAVRRLFSLLSGPLYRYGQGFCRNPEDAEEVMQEVLLALYRSLRRFRGDASLTTWAYTVARNACARQRRKRVGEPDAMTSLDARRSPGDRPIEIPDTGADPGKELERRELGERLQSAIADLPPGQRDVLVLRDVEGLRASRVAEILGIGERAVKSRLHRARAALRDTLTPYLEDAPPEERAACPDPARALSRYLEGELDEETCRRLDRHVQECARCSAECATLREAVSACRKRRSEPVPEPVQAAVRQAIQRVLERS